jgi:hypothetical protein
VLERAYVLGHAEVNLLDSSRKLGSDTAYECLLGSDTAYKCIEYQSLIIYDGSSEYFRPQLSEFSVVVFCGWIGT